MFHVPKHNPLQKKLQARAELYQTIRRFFLNRAVLEVETPVLVPTCIPEAHIQTFQVYSPGSNANLYLQASPELLMKQLLAQGSGDIFQISKAFRANEFGARHRSEFSLLEWYRVGWVEQQLQQEISELLQSLLDCSPTMSMTYRQLFLKYLNLDIRQAQPIDFEACAKNQNLNIQSNPDWTLLDWQDCLWGHIIESQLGWQFPLFVTEYPIAQAALAQIKLSSDPDEPNQPVAARFELYYQGLELANGYQELTNLSELNQRYIEQGLELPEYVAKNWQGLPACSGVAMGLDRVLMLQQKIKDIEYV